MKISLKKILPQFQALFSDIRRIAVNQNARIYLVGGAVRDLLLNRTVSDIDIAVEGDAIALAENFAVSCNSTARRHHSFGTAAVIAAGHKIDFVTARNEKYPTFGVLPMIKPADLKQDLFRRDFTINAMAVSINADDYGVLIDPYNGTADIKSKYIRVLHDTSFCDDGTRVLRAVRFEQRFGFRIEPHTLKLMQSAKHIGAVNLIHPHRLRDELVLMAKESCPWLCFNRLQALYGFDFIQKGFKFTAKHRALLRSIAKYDKWYVQTFKHHRKLEKHIIYLAGLTHKMNPATIDSIMARFDFNKGNRIIISSCRAGLTMVKSIIGKIDNYWIYDFFKPLSYETIVFLCAAYPRIDFKRKIILFLSKLFSARLLIKGEDLQTFGIPQGEIYASIFAYVLKEKINRGFKTKQEEINAALTIWQKLKR